MYKLQSFLFLLFTAFSLQAFCQADTLKVPVDSAQISPASQQKPVRKPSLKADSTALKTAQKEKAPAVVKDSARLVLERLPKQAVVRSAIIPGWGQIGNKRWWKVPFIYGGFISLGLAIDFNQRYYKEFLHELQYYAKNNNQFENPLYNQPQYSYQSIVDAKDFYRRNRDLSILGCVAVYAVNLIDAYVDAKFFRYDISDELALKVYPSAKPQFSYANSAPVPALTFKLSF